MKKRSTMHVLWFIGLFVSPTILGPYGPVAIIIGWLIDAQNTKNHNKKFDTWKQQEQLDQIKEAILEARKF